MFSQWFRYPSVPRQENKRYPCTRAKIEREARDEYVPEFRSIRGRKDDQEG